MCEYAQIYSLNNIILDKSKSSLSYLIYRGPLFFEYCLRINASYANYLFHHSMPFLELTFLYHITDVITHGFDRVYDLPQNSFIIR